MIYYKKSQCSSYALYSDTLYENTFKESASITNKNLDEEAFFKAESEIHCTDGSTVYTPIKDSTIDKLNVINPSHYDVMPDLKAIELIAMAMTQEQFYGYCLGNIMKYRLRAGKKDNLARDISKADNHPNLYEKYVHLCR